MVGTRKPLRIASVKMSLNDFGVFDVIVKYTRVESKAWIFKI